MFVVMKIIHWYIVVNHKLNIGEWCTQRGGFRVEFGSANIEGICALSKEEIRISKWDIFEMQFGSYVEN